MIRKIPVLLMLSIGAFVIGVSAVAFWTSRLHWQEIRPPTECWSKKFPGKSVSINDLDSRSHSVFDESEFGSSEDDRFYTAFHEERFEKSKFDDENSFPEIAKADEIYRFSWLRTFHSPFVFRAYRIGNDKFLVAKETDGRGGYGLGKLIINKSRKLDDREWCKFIHLLDAADFWNKGKIEVKWLAHDGAFWNIEGVRERRYYITGEQSPEDGKFRDACIYLMRISGLNIDKNASEFY